MVSLNITDDASDVVDALTVRAQQISDALAAAEDEAVTGPSNLPEWTRLTIACHLRYCATTLRRMTTDALRGEPTSYYPLGRATQRPATLEPAADESMRMVVSTLETTARELCSTWRELPRTAWSIVVEETAANPDLGAMTLSAWAMAALTEFEVHGCDLALDLPDWSETFVRRALTSRLTRLNSRRTTHRPGDPTMRHSWLLCANDGTTYFVSTANGVAAARTAASGEFADTVITASTRDLVALLLGRDPTGEVLASGNGGVPEFQRRFPGP